MAVSEKKFQLCFGQKILTELSHRNFSQRNYSRARSECCSCMMVNILLLYCLQIDTVNKLKESLGDEKLRGVILHNYPREQTHIEQFNQSVSNTHHPHTHTPSHCSHPHPSQLPEGTDTYRAVQPEREYHPPPSPSTLHPHSHPPTLLLLHNNPREQTHIGQFNQSMSTTLLQPEREYHPHTRTSIHPHPHPPQLPKGTDTYSAVQPKREYHPPPSPSPTHPPQLPTVLYSYPLP